MEKMVKKVTKGKSTLNGKAGARYTIKSPAHKTPITGFDKNVLYWLDSSSSVTNTIQSEFDLISIAQRGITKGSVDSLASYLGISRKNMAEDIFDISVKTLERKDAHTKLDKKTSSHALEIAKVVQHVYEVFRDEAKVKLWINRENRALNNLKPVQLFDTLTGLNLVHDILGRIEEGVYS
jgi:putative toxin-antitoxin system antitoxin component (TIGR02293 family)